MVEMAYPLADLIEYSGNVYEVTCAIVKRSYQLAVMHEPGNDADDDKIASEAAREIFSEDVEYRFEE